MTSPISAKDEPDVTRMPLGILGFRALVDGLPRFGDLNERHYLELKGKLDLSSKDAAAKIAKFILGAANRMPDVAKPFFDGHAILALGVETGRIVGVQSVDPLIIEQGVRPYLSDEGPAWDQQTVELSGLTVLLVIVKPPRWGAAAWLCHKDSSSGLKNGRTYVRPGAETREATADEVRRLEARGRYAAPEAFDVKIGGSLFSFEVDPQVLARYLASVSQDLLAKLPQQAAETHPTVGLASALNRYQLATALFTVAGKRPEQRTEQKYREEIAGWNERAAGHLAQAVAAMCALRADPVSFDVTNSAEKYFGGVEVQIHLDGGVHAVKNIPRGQNKNPLAGLLPPRPRPWGPTELTSATSPWHIRWI